MAYAFHHNTIILCYSLPTSTLTSYFQLIQCLFSSYFCFLPLSCRGEPMTFWYRHKDDRFSHTYWFWLCIKSSALTLSNHGDLLGSFFQYSVIGRRWGCRDNPHVQHKINAICNIEDSLAYQDFPNLGVPTADCACLFPFEVLAPFEDRYLRG